MKIKLLDFPTPVVYSDKFLSRSDFLQAGYGFGATRSGFFAIGSGFLKTGSGFYPPGYDFTVSRSGFTLSDHPEVSYVSYPELFESEIRIEMDNGIVTLTGQVDNEEHRKAAEKVAGNVEGVKSVINKLQISHEHHRPHEPMEVPSPNSGDPVNTLKLSGA